MTPCEFHEKMLELQKMSCPEERHIAMDELMCEVLKELGYRDGVEVWENTTPMWFG